MKFKITKQISKLAEWILNTFSLIILTAFHCIVNSALVIDDKDILSYAVFVLESITIPIHLHIWRNKT
jgi:hypothetical protein